MALLFGIVGALVLGQAAVSAGIVSPILIIIVAGIAVLHYNMCVCASILHRSEERLGGILFEKEQL